MKESEKLGVYQAWLTAESIRFRIRALKTRFRDHRAELNAMNRHVGRSGTACDVGANKGSFIYWLSSRMSQGRVVAFEPQPHLARRLTEICGVIGLANVRVEPKAVYSSSGSMDLFVPDDHEPGATLERPLELAQFKTIAVPVVSLDDFFDAAEPIAALKIDVEGAELHVLKGAERILRQHAPLLIVECEKRHLAPGQDVETVFAYLRDLGYEGEFVCRNRLLPISAFDAAVHQRQDGEWFWKSADYCNNFIFRKSPGR